jgi:hypothetical protein
LKDDIGGLSMCQSFGFCIEHPDVVASAPDKRSDQAGPNGWFNRRQVIAQLLIDL